MSTENQRLVANRKVVCQKFIIFSNVNWTDSDSIPNIIAWMHCFSISRGQYTKEFAISVPPHITPFYLGQDVLKEGDASTLYCTVDLGDTPIDLEWFLNGKQIGNHVEGIVVTRFGQKSSILSIDKIKAGHAGKYTCRATNTAGSAYFTIKLAVNGIFHYLRIFFTFYLVIIVFQYLFHLRLSLLLQLLVPKIIRNWVVICLTKKIYLVCNWDISKKDTRLL